MRADNKTIKRYTPIKSEKSYFDGDWAYWGKRSGIYPGYPSCLTECLKEQYGKCWHCKRVICSNDPVITGMIQPHTGKAVRRIMHEHCSLSDQRNLILMQSSGKEVSQEPGAT